MYKFWYIHAIGALSMYSSQGTEDYLLRQTNKIVRLTRDNCAYETNVFVYHKWQ